MNGALSADGSQGTAGTISLAQMFKTTGGTTQIVGINTTYYTSNTIVE